MSKTLLLGRAFRLGILLDVLGTRAIARALALGCSYRCRRHLLLTEELLRTGRLESQTSLTKDRSSPCSATVVEWIVLPGLSIEREDHIYASLDHRACTSDAGILGHIERPSYDAGPRP